VTIHTKAKLKTNIFETWLGPVGVNVGIDPDAGLEILVFSSMMWPII
jgi:hypothetical protein